MGAPWARHVMCEPACNDLTMIITIAIFWRYCTSFTSVTQLRFGAEIFVLRKVYEAISSVIIITPVIFSILICEVILYNRLYINSFRTEM